MTLKQRHKNTRMELLNIELEELTRFNKKKQKKRKKKERKKTF